MSKKSSAIKLLVMIILLAAIFYLASHKKNGAVGSGRQSISFSFPYRKQERFIESLARIIATKHPQIWNLERGDIESKIVQINAKYPLLIDNNIVDDAVTKEDNSLFQDSRTKNPLNYSISIVNGKPTVHESTTAEYYTDNPESKFRETIKDKKLDFKIIAAVNFGLRGYLFNEEGKVSKEWGDYNTAYYSTSYHEARKLIAWSIPGLKLITIIDAKSMNALKSFEGYESNAVAFDSNHLYFFDGNGGSSSLYRVNLDDLKSIEAVLSNWDIKYARGLIVDEEQKLYYISDTFNNRIIIVDSTTSLLQTEVHGLSMPNGISRTPRGTFLIADEHNDTIREVDLGKFDHISSFPARFLRSPAHAVEIKKGKFAGLWLIADADHNRVILADPANQEVYFEIRNLRSVLSLDVIYPD